MKKLLFLVLLFATLINVSCHKDEIDPIPEEEEEEELDGAQKATVKIVASTMAFYSSDGEEKSCYIYIGTYNNKNYASLSPSTNFKYFGEINSNGDYTWQGINVSSYKYYIDYRGIRYFFTC